VTIKQAEKMLREFIGDRDEHHRNCSAYGKSYDSKKCGCYARGRQAVHEALDLILKKQEASK
jgi:hypothetical protein